MFHRRVRRLLLLVLVLVASVAALLTQRRYRSQQSARPNTAGGLISSQLLSELTAIEERERRVDQTSWAAEQRAEQCGAVFDALWDQLNQATNKFDVLASFPIGRLLVAQYQAPRTIAHEIQVAEPAGSEVSWLQPGWQQFLATWERNGWVVGHIEFRQRAFDPAANGRPERSRFSFRADLEQTNGLARATIEGELAVEWNPNAPQAQPVIRQLDARQLAIRWRKGEPAFRPILSESIAPLDKWLFIDPLILYDLDGDGLSEIILAGKNLVYRRRPDGQYEAGPLCKYSPERIFTAVIADFDGDGFADLLCAKPQGLVLFHGSAQGTFDEPGRLVWTANPPLKYGQVLTCGDIDQDGDLDVFLAQYKSPYFHGQMPTPYYDANDGDPAYLLLNDGHGNFSDATESSGLGPKRRRRSYSASFVRLDGDSALDLVVVSDFAGLDIYRNDGHGHFSDVTRSCLPNSLGFGMAHTLADFNRDGRLDLLMIGMDSPTVDRLDHLGLRRAGAPEEPDVRSRLASGNRLFLARPTEGFEQTALSRTVAGSGWSWGCAASDWDNDGFPDLYIANGHDTRASVRDYEPEFWLHDIYIAGSTNDRAAELYFQSKFTSTRGRGYSYGGYEQNRLYLNLGAASFFEAGHLLGVGLEQDCRNVVADDLDGDGRMDLLVTTFEVWPVAKQTLRVYRNMLTDSGNWIGFRLREQGGGKSPAGTVVTIQYGDHTATAQIVTGDSYRSQSANTLHFGLGSATNVARAIVQWPDGARTELENPPVNQYTRVKHPR